MRRRADSVAAGALACATPAALPRARRSRGAPPRADRADSSTTPGHPGSRCSQPIAIASRPRSTRSRPPSAICARRPADGARAGGLRGGRPVRHPGAPAAGRSLLERDTSTPRRAARLSRWLSATRRARREAHRRGALHRGPRLSTRFRRRSAARSSPPGCCRSRSAARRALLDRFRARGRAAAARRRRSCTGSASPRAPRRARGGRCSRRDRGLSSGLAETQSNRALALADEALARVSRTPRGSTRGARAATSTAAVARDGERRRSGSRTTAARSRTRWSTAGPADARRSRASGIARRGTRRLRARAHGEAPLRDEQEFLQPPPSAARATTARCRAARGARGYAESPMARHAEAALGDPCAIPGVHSCGALRGALAHVRWCCSGRSPEGPDRGVLACRLPDRSAWRIQARRCFRSGSASCRGATSRRADRDAVHCRATTSKRIRAAPTRRVRDCSRRSSAPRELGRCPARRRGSARPERRPADVLPSARPAGA